MGSFEEAKAKLKSDPKDYGNSDISRAKASETLIHPSFPSQGEERRAHEGSQSQIPDKEE